ncbi:MAG: T9SS type A sorting domain-containing protein, partial [Flavobacteriales bacterium]|nr:T9SS type A sorting domain-containing protein [Flavobacteriales bacterium]
PESYNCVAPGDCQDPGDGSGNYWSYSSCMTACPIPETYDCDAVTGCYDPGTGQGLYTSLTGCQANCNTTSINSEDLANFNIFPNPVSDVLNIKSDKEIIKVEISDILGKIILSEINPKNSINVKRLQKGIYSIKITFKDENSIIQKIIK